MLEEFFYLMKNLNISYTELSRLPIRYRRWFIDRCIKQNTPASGMTNMGGIQIDDDIPISQVLGKMNS